MTKKCLGVAALALALLVSLLGTGRGAGRQDGHRQRGEGDGLRQPDLDLVLRVGREFRPRTVEQRQRRSGRGPTSATTCGRSTSRSRRRARPA